jgi:hypothetical protein
MDLQLPKQSVPITTDVVGLTEPSIGASHQVSVRLAKQFQRKRFTEIDQ